MKTVIKRVLDLETEAQQKLLEAHRRLEDGKARIDSEVAGQCRRILSESEGQAKTACGQETVVMEAELARIRAEGDRQVAALKARFAENRSQWVDRIVRHITE